MPTTKPEDEDTTIRLHIDGKEYALDPNDLELGEVELVEEELGVPWDDVDWRFVKPSRLLAYLLIHRDNPSFTLEDAERIKLGALDDKAAEASNGNGNGSGGAKKKRPTKAAANA
jgi:hypothetical protein